MEKRTSNISFVEKPVKKHEVIRIRSNSLRHVDLPAHHPKAGVAVPPPITHPHDILKEYEMDFALSLRELDVQIMLIAVHLQPDEPSGCYVADACHSD